MKSNQNKLTQLILEFISERNWDQFHTGKDFAMSMSIESSEVLELFLWKDSNKVDKMKLKDEIGDVFYSLLLLANKYGIDIEDALVDKLEENKEKYPVSKFRGINKKYSEVE